MIDDKKMRLENPAIRFSKLITERIDKKKRVKPLDQEQRAEFLKAARSRRPYFFLFVIAVRCGRRLSECFGLKWTDFERAAILYSLRATCTAHAIDVWAYLQDVLEWIPTHPDRRRAELLPRNWPATRARAEP